MLTFRDTEDGLFWVGEGEDLLDVAVEAKVDLSDNTVRFEQGISTSLACDERAHTWFCTPLACGSCR